MPHARRKPCFTTVAILTLALGIGANTAVFTVADALLLRPPPFDRPEWLHWIHDVNDALRLTVNDAVPPSPGNFVDWRDRNRSFDYMVAWRNWSSLLYGVVPADGPTLIGAALVVLVVALSACWRPAWRATRVDPMTVLRAE